MANWYEPTAEQRAGWEEWVAERPPAVREVAKRFPPWVLYWLHSPGQRVCVVSIMENDDGCLLKVVVSGDYNFVVTERMVFGVDPATLTECDLPKEGEIVGVGTPEKFSRGAGLPS